MSKRRSRSKGFFKFVKSMAAHMSITPQEFIDRHLRKGSRPSRGMRRAERRPWNAVENERRRRQMEKGMLGPSNGLRA